MKARWMKRSSPWRLPTTVLNDEKSFRSNHEFHHPDPLPALKACSAVKLLDIGRKLHADIGVRSSGVYVETALVDMYSKCNNMEEAQKAFDSMTFRDAASWNALILGYAVNGEEDRALDCFRRMEESGCLPNDRSFVSGLMACVRLAEKEPGLCKFRCLETGMKLHSKATTAGCDSDVFVGNVLVWLYSKCGSLIDARSTFDRMKLHDVVSWTTLLSAYVENGESLTAIDLFAVLISQDIAVTSRTFVAALTACSLLAAEEPGRMVDGKVVKAESLANGVAIHSQAVERSLHTDMFLESALVDMYSKCGSLSNALEVFTKMRQRDVVAWTALIQGYAENGEGEEALRLFYSMECPPNARTFVAALMACSCLPPERDSALEVVRALHSQAADYGYDKGDTFVGNMLLGAYARCGSLADAHKVFEIMTRRDVASWTSLMLGYVEAEEPELALGLFLRMRMERCVPDSRVFLGALMACACLAGSEQGSDVGNGVLVKVRALERGMEIHSQAVKRSCESDVFVASALVDMYAKCGSVADVRGVFQRVMYLDVVLWNALMLAYVESGEVELVFELFSCMKRLGCLPDSQTFVALVTACATSASKEEGGVSKTSWLEKGMSVHQEALASGKDSNLFVSNALIDMYGKCGSLVDARRVFERMDLHDLVSWNSLILATYEIGEEKLALELFVRLKLESFPPDSRSYVIAILACGALVDVESGKQIHVDVSRVGMCSSLVTDYLVEFYGKCGSMTLAQILFDSLEEPANVSTWNSLLAGYSRQGDARRVLELFETMKEGGQRPDRATFLTVLTTCSHAGLVDKGKELFQTMVTVHGLSPSLVHLRSMVDLLGRANLLEEALGLLEGMALKEDVLAWTAFLAACGKWRDVRLGKVAYEKLMKLDEKNTGAYSMMANLLQEQVCEANG